MYLFIYLFIVYLMIKHFFYKMPNYLLSSQRYGGSDSAWIGFNMLDDNAGFVWSDETSVSSFIFAVYFCMILFLA